METLSSKQLRLIRSVLRLSVEYVSSMAGISRMTLSRIESGRCTTQYYYKYLELLYDQYIRDNPDEMDQDLYDDVNFIKYEMNS